MILQLNKKRFALNLGEDFEYINTYIKGKRGKHIADNYRLHFRGNNWSRYFNFYCSI